MSDDVVSQIQLLVTNHINQYVLCSDDNKRSIPALIGAIGTLVSYDNMLPPSINDAILSLDQFQSKLSNLNEKTARRKEYGVYYTDVDAVNFVISTTMRIFMNQDNLNHVSISDAVVFDPTCGSGEFLVSMFKYKLKESTESSSKCITILNTIHGNDIDPISVLICKLRLFFEAYPLVKDSDLSVVVSTLNSNFTDFDFVNYNCNNPWADVILGNPPYVEDSKYPGVVGEHYGNVYANVVVNSLSCLKNGGVLGYVLPISYSSTPRMSKLRNLVEATCDIQYVSTFADRPDSLFTSVHQKHSVVCARKLNGIRRVFTTGYNYWYTSERNNLFHNMEYVENHFVSSEGYPKIGNKYDLSIFSKMTSISSLSLLKCISVNSPSKIYVNMRATFWIKAFAFNPGSNEYKSYSVNGDMKGFLLCLLNSSLFFWYWTVFSDCWHITNKELTHFFVPDFIENMKHYDALYQSLEKKLEDTKKFVGTKQIEYEYKHRFCKEEIDDIDRILAKEYGLTSEELQYLIGYRKEYRMAEGSK